MGYDVKTEPCVKGGTAGETLFIKLKKLQTPAPLQVAEEAMLKCIEFGVIDLDIKYVTAELTPDIFDNYMMLSDEAAAAAAPIDVHPTTTLLLQRPVSIAPLAILNMIKKCNKKNEAGVGFIEVSESGCMDEYNLDLLKLYAGKINPESHVFHSPEDDRPPPMLWQNKRPRAQSDPGGVM